jgi:hypothetical protein
MVGDIIYRVTVYRLLFYEKCLGSPGFATSVEKALTPSLARLPSTPSGHTSQWDDRREGRARRGR